MDGGPGRTRARCRTSGRNAAAISQRGCGRSRRRPDWTRPVLDAIARIRDETQPWQYFNRRVPPRKLANKQLASVRPRPHELVDGPLYKFTTHAEHHHLHQVCFVQYSSIIALTQPNSL